MKISHPLSFKTKKRKREVHITLEDLKRAYDECGGCRYVVCYLCENSVIPIFLCASREECMRELGFRKNNCNLTCGVDLLEMSMIMLFE